MIRIGLLIALLLLTGCAATTPPWEQTDPDQQASAFADLGIAYLEQGQFDRALRNLERSLSIRPRNPRALHGMALTLQQQGEDAMAEDYFQRALRQAPNKTVARNNYAAFLYNQERYQDAKAQLDIASRDIFYNNRALVFENMGLVALALDQPAQALDYFQRSLSLNRRSVTVHRELLRLRLDRGELLQAEGHWQTLRSGGVDDLETLTLGRDLALARGDHQTASDIQHLIDYRR